MAREAERVAARMQRSQSVSEKLFWGEDENKKRGNWTGRLDFILSCLAYSMGFGNIGRFPYLAYKNGGGAFLTAYLILMITMGMPLFFLELSFGQYASLGPITIWKVSPLFKGVGYAMVTMSALVAVYYNVILSWSVFYLFASFIMFLALVKGIKSSGRVVYVTAVASLVLLLTMLVVGATLPGADVGVRMYLKPNWETLASPAVWYDAATQVFFSLSVGWGGIITLASYNRFHSDVHRDAILVSVFVVVISVIAGFVVFCVIGFMRGMELDGVQFGNLSAGVALGGNLSGNLSEVVADVTRLDNVTGSVRPTSESVLRASVGLAFVVYPEVFLHLPLPVAWSIAFFVLLVMVGIDSQFVVLETISTAIIDESPERFLRRNLVVNLVVCTLVFLPGLALVTQAGPYYLHVLDTFVAGWSNLVVCLLELVVICWVYGIDSFSANIALMLRRYPSRWWRVMWKYVTPLVIVAVLVASWVDLPVARVDRWVFPASAQAVGWAISSVPLVWLPLAAAHSVVTAPGRTWREKFVNSLRPAEDWGPALEEHRMEKREQETDTEFVIVETKL